MGTLGVVTIGQAPRDDIVRDIASGLGRAAAVVQTGALDGLGGDGIAALAPGPGDEVLVTRLGDGREARVAERAIVPRLEDAVARAEAAGADATLLVCTGAFPPLRHARPLLMSGALLTAGVAAVASGLRLAALCPDPSQVESVRAKWRGAGVALTGVWSASPYVDRDNEAARAARAIEDADAVVLDCMGYDVATKAVVERVSGLRALLARHVAGRLAGLMLD